MMKKKWRLEKLTKENEEHMDKLEKLNVAVEEQKQDLLELEVDMKNIMKWKKFWKILLFLVFIVLIVKMF